MNFLNTLLNNVNPDRAVSFFGKTYNVSLNWIGELIRTLVNWVGIVGIGIILFSVLLKLVVLPFDIFQRINMSKQNAKMKQNQEKLQKLQKQYANDKAMYNQKMMEMYKENGINVFSSCLPAILSIVIFIIAINAFTAYSQYANLAAYNKMVKAYNAEISAHTATVDDDLSLIDINGESHILVEDKDGAQSGKYVYYIVKNDGFTQEALGGEEMKEYLSSVLGNNKKHYVNSEQLLAYDATAKAEVEEAKAKPENEFSEDKLCANYVKKLAQKAVKAAYKADIADDTSFLWIKNIWETDASYTHPISKYSDIKSDMQREKMEVPGKNVKFTKMSSFTNAYEKESYNEVTRLLKSEKSAPNGYYILIVLSIGTILLQQFVSMRSQKEQQKFSSVDGTGAMNQKTMMIMMTVMFGIFSFMYSAAFSINMVMSNLLSLVTTVLINKLVERKMEKEEEKALQAKYNKRFPGRTYPGNNRKGK